MRQSKIFKKIVAVVVTVSMVAALGLSAMAGSAVPKPPKEDGTNLSITGYTVERESAYYQVEINYSATNLAAGKQITALAYANSFSGTALESWTSALKTVAIEQEAYVADAGSVDNTKISFEIKKSEVETEGQITDPYVIVRLGCEDANAAAVAIVNLNMADSWAPDTITFMNGATEVSAVIIDFATYGTDINGFEDADDVKVVVNEILSGYTMKLSKDSNSVNINYAAASLSTESTYDPTAAAVQAMTFKVTVSPSGFSEYNTNEFATLTESLETEITVNVEPQDKFEIASVKAFDAVNAEVTGVDYTADDTSTIAQGIAKVVVYDNSDKSEEWQLTADAWQVDAGKVTHTIEPKANPVKGQNTVLKKLELTAVTHSQDTDFYVASAKAFAGVTEVTTVPIMSGQTADEALAVVQAAFDSVTVYGSYNNADKSEAGWTGTAAWSGTAPSGTLAYDATTPENNMYTAEVTLSAPDQRGTYKGDNAGGITVTLSVQVIDGTQITGAVFKDGASDVTSIDVYTTDDNAAVIAKLQDVTDALDVVVSYGAGSTESGWSIDQSSWTLTDNVTTWTAKANLVAPTEHTATIGAITQISITANKVVQLGDADQDGDVDADDYAAVMNHINGESSITGANNLAAANVTTADDSLTIWDAYYIARKANGEDDSLPAGVPAYSTSAGLSLKVKFTDNAGTELDYVSQGSAAKAVVYLENANGSDVDFILGNVELNYANVATISIADTDYEIPTLAANRTVINTGTGLELKTIPANGELELASYNITIHANETLGDTTFFTAGANVFADYNIDAFDVNATDGTIEVVKTIEADGYNALASKTVDFGTAVEDVQDLLMTAYPNVTVTKESDSIVVPVTGWACSGYDAVLPSTYTFVATIADEYHDQTNHIVVDTLGITVQVSVTVNKLSAAGAAITAGNVSYTQGEGVVDVATILADLASTSVIISDGTYSDDINASTISWAADGGATELDITTADNSLKFTATVMVETDHFTGEKTAEVFAVVVDKIIANSSATISDAYLNKYPIATVTIPAADVNGTDSIIVTVKDAEGIVKHTETQVVALVPDQTEPYIETITLTKNLSEVGFIDGDTYTISVAYGDRDITGGATGTAADYVPYVDNRPPAGMLTPIVSDNSGNSSDDKEEESETPEETETPEEPDTPVAGPFADVADDHWAAEYITILKDKGVVNGINDTEYAPEASVTRAEFAKMMVNIFGLELTEAESIFADCVGEWFTPYVNAAYEAGYVTGVGETEFAPNATITREQVCAVVGRALNKVSENEVTFTDAHAISDYAAGYVAVLSEVGIINGYEDGSFAPGNSITRAEIAKILVGVLEHI